MNKDKVFADKMEKIEPFQFNEKVTLVFDDMLNRSVPQYNESITRQAQLAERFYQPGTLIYDLGCSNGNLGLAILETMKQHSPLMSAVDSSWPMIRTYAQRLEKRDDGKNVMLVCGLLENLRIDNASVVLINLTLQFLNPLNRDRLLKEIYNGMEPGGILLLTEKTEHPDHFIQSLWIEFYKRFKLENGYSDLEISQKRDALEKVLIPDSIQTHMNRMKNSGFQKVDIWLKWFNFASMIAIK